MQRLLIILLSAFLLGGCGSASKSTTNKSAKADLSAADIVGVWVTDGHECHITESSISIDWISDREADKVRSVYWRGTFDCKVFAESKEFTSIRDKEETEYALLASGDPDKVFKLEDGKIVYTTGLMGTTTTMRLSKVE